jgi:hypothetical protein
LGTLGFHVVAAQLNINSGGVSFGLTQSQLDTIIAGVDPTSDSSVAAAFALIFAANELGCPLS